MGNVFKDYVIDPITSIAGPVIGAIGTGYDMYNKYHNDKQNRKAQRQMNDLSSFAEQIAMAQWKDVQPVRQSIIDRLSSFMQGNLDPTTSAMYGPIKSNTEQQYGVAKDAIMSNMPKGGGLQDSLARLEMSKAGTLSQLIGNLVQDEYNNAYQMGSSAAQPAINAIGAAMGAGPGVAQLNQGIAASGSMGDKMNDSGLDILELLKLMGMGG